MTELEKDISLMIRARALVCRTAPTNMVVPYFLV